MLIVKYLLLKKINRMSLGKRPRNHTHNNWKNKTYKILAAGSTATDQLTNVYDVKIIFLKLKNNIF